MEHYFTNNKNLKSELRTIDYKYKEFAFHFYSDNGVFSKDKIDFGSRLLVETFLERREEPVKTILDVGCGYGFMGIVLAKVLDCKATLVDVNKRAVHLTKMNIKEHDVKAEVFVSNLYENVNDNFDVILTNPPIRAGKNVVFGILDDALSHLKEKGTLWFVIRKDQGAKSTIKEVEKKYTTKIIKKEKGFYIIKAKKEVDMKNECC